MQSFTSGSTNAFNLTRREGGGFVGCNSIACLLTRREMDLETSQADARAVHLNVTRA